MILELRNICKDYIQEKMVIPVLKNVSFSMEEGEYVAVMGPSGSGKTTLMNIVGCLDQATSGTFWLDGQDMSTCSENELSDIRLKKIGFVFQNFQLLPRQTALENVELPLTYAGVSRKERRERAAQALARVGLEDRMHFRPSQLSGGQKQRVAIARAILRNSPIIILDEATASVDVETERMIQNAINHIAGTRTIIAIAHRLSTIRNADLILLLKHGTIAERGTHEELMRLGGEYRKMVQAQVWKEEDE